MREIDWGSITSVTDFAYFSNFYDALNSLEGMAATEKWSYSNDTSERRNKKNPILENYFHHTFKRLRDEYISAPTEENHSNKSI